MLNVQHVSVSDYHYDAELSDQISPCVAAPNEHKSDFSDIAIGYSGGDTNEVRPVRVWVFFIYTDADDLKEMNSSFPQQP